MACNGTALPYIGSSIVTETTVHSSLRTASQNPSH